MKQQFALFNQLYPEYVERNAVRYPIPDHLLAKMPELHGGESKQKPAGNEVRVDSDSFERLLYIWEFCNNFNEFLQTPLFKVEELQACLAYEPSEDPRCSMSLSQQEEGLDWNE